MPEIRVEDHTKEVLERLRKQVQLGFAAVGAEAEGYAKENCPVDTGRLRNSITWACTTKNDAKNEDGAPQGIPEENSLYLGTNVEYGVFVEYCDYQHKVGQRHFLRDALANHGDHYQEIMQAALDAISNT